MSAEPHTDLVPRVLPRGPHQLAREVVEASQRGRLLDAMAMAVAEKGYGATSVADVIVRAGVSRKTFYAYFRDKEDCFLAAYDVGVDVLMATLRAAGAETSDPLERARARVRTYLEVLAAEPAFARTFLIEIGAAGPRALERRRQVMREFAALSMEMLELAGLPQVEDDIVHLAAAGAGNEIVTDYVATGRTAELPELEDTLLQIQLKLLLDT